jgi:hypothetical protein
MSIRFQGGCACGAIRYESSADPQFSFHCQCRQCQRAGGTGHASLLAAPANALSIRGTLRFHDQKADSGNTSSRGFCPACGNPIVNKSSGNPQIRFIHAASLDDPGRFKPEKLAYSANAQPWDHVAPDLERI